jgi:hypothetical protein
MEPGLQERPKHPAPSISESNGTRARPLVHTFREVRSGTCSDHGRYPKAGLPTHYLHGDSFWDPNHSSLPGCPRKTHPTDEPLSTGSSHIRRPWSLIKDPRFRTSLPPHEAVLRAAGREEREEGERTQHQRGRPAPHAWTFGPSADQGLEVQGNFPGSFGRARTCPDGGALTPSTKPQRAASLCPTVQAGIRLTVSPVQSSSISFFCHTRKKDLTL